MLLHRPRAVRLQLWRYTGTKAYLSARGTSFTRPIGQSPVDIGVPSFSGLAAQSSGAQE